MFVVVEEGRVFPSGLIREERPVPRRSTPLASERLGSSGRFLAWIGCAAYTTGDTGLHQCP